ncbi:hypothetical protein OCAR_6192 [Afipia carboxidovorans OM5]|nr:hypothetical protein [Afipia carboxidovorans]ACI93306.1 hypothetical protein OCAR_6192 [Afipia carboxidovorans OM5]BEV47425.1 hypothetical protein CRBSH125_36080 [Afipia carboxidovorans]
MFPLILGLLGACGLFYLASAMRYSGWAWSHELCRQGAPLCDHPHWLLIAAGVAIGIAMIRSMAKA